MRMSSLAAMAAILLGATQVQADDMAKTARKLFDVTIPVFGPTKGLESGEDYVQPVDSPNAEHAVTWTTANAASFTETVEGG